MTLLTPELEPSCKFTQGFPGFSRIYFQGKDLELVRGSHILVKVEDLKDGVSNLGEKKGFSVKVW